MQAQDTTTLFLLKLWPWVEANKNRLIGGAVVAVVAIFIIWYVACQRDSKEVAAGQALTQAVLSGGQSADTYLKIAEQYPGTVAAQRALLQSAAALFDAGKFPEAQAQFESFLNAHPDSEFSGQALLGVATSLDAQSKTNLAVGAYQKVISNASDFVIVSAAKFGLARIDEAQGRLNDALALYQDVASAEPGASLGSEAAMRLMELRSKLPAAAPAPTPAAPLKSNQ